MEERRTNKRGLSLSLSVRKFWHFSNILCIFGYSERVPERNSHTVTRNADSSSCAGWPGFWIHKSELLASAQAFCVYYVPKKKKKKKKKKDKGILWLALTYTHIHRTNTHHRATTYFLLYRKKMSVFGICTNTLSKDLYLGNIESLSLPVENLHVFK